MAERVGVTPEALGQTGRVYPSGAARATAAVPRLPPAPPRFSTITGLPKASPSWVFISLAAMSVPPPAGKQATMVICRSGYSARARSNVAPATAISSIAGIRRRRPRVVACETRDGIFGIGLSSGELFIGGRLG